MLNKCKTATLVSFIHFPWQYLLLLWSFLLPAAVFTAALVHITSGSIYRHFS